MKPALSTDIPGNEEKEKDRVASFPHLVFMELLAILGVVLFFVLLSIYLDAPLEEIANPSETPNPTKAPWYFVGLQELLVYFDPWIGGVMIPVLIILGLMAVPFLSRSGREDQPESPGYQSLAMWIFATGLALWFGLIIIGQFFRGPGWHLYWPWEPWNVRNVSGETLRSFSLPLGLAFLASYFLLVLVVPALRWRAFYRRMGPARYAVFMVFMALFGGVLIKIMLRLFWGIKYILVTPWFNI